MIVAKQIEEIEQRIKIAANKANRDERSIRLIGICKYQSVEKIRAFLQSGHKELGQNYVQGLQKQAHEMGDEFFEANWHFVGRLQTNKVKALMKLFGPKPPLIHTLDRLSLLKTLHQYGKDHDIEIPCLIQVLPEKFNENKVHTDHQRSGCRQDEILALLKLTKELTHVSINGLMLLPPQEKTDEETQKHFRFLKDLKNSLVSEVEILSCPRIQMQELSMGMTADLELAILEGATYVRVGTGVFGRRDAT